MQNDKLKQQRAEFRRKTTETDSLSRLVGAYALRKYNVNLSREHELLIASHAMRMHEQTFIPKVECMVSFVQDAIKFFGYTK